MNLNTIHCGDAVEYLKSLPDNAVNCVVTSPPYYGLRDYGVDGQIGLEGSVGEYLANLHPVFQEVYRVLRDDGVLWLNMGDSYNGYKANTRGGARWAVCKEYDVEFTDKMSIRLIEKNLPPEFKTGNLPHGVGYAEVDGKLVRMTDDEFEAFLETLPKEEEDHE